MSALMVDSARPEPSRLYRWTVLLFVSLAMGGNYYIYDSINPLERIFIDKLGFSATAFRSDRNRLDFTAGPCCCSSAWRWAATTTSTTALTRWNAFLSTSWAFLPLRSAGRSEERRVGQGRR